MEFECSTTVENVGSIVAFDELCAEKYSGVGGLCLKRNQGPSLPSQKESVDAIILSIAKLSDRRVECGFA